MITQGGENLKTTLYTSYTCNKYWSQGVVPKTWKKENRIYLPKPDKADYGEGKAYRGISLSSTVGKVYERITDTRLLAWL